MDPGDKRRDDNRGSLMQLIVNITVLAAIYALIAVGYVLIYRVSRVLNLAHGELMMVGAYLLLVTAGLFAGHWLAARDPGRRTGSSLHRPDWAPGHAPDLTHRELAACPLPRLRDLRRHPQSHRRPLERPVRRGVIAAARGGCGPARKRL